MAQNNNRTEYTVTVGTINHQIQGTFTSVDDGWSDQVALAFTDAIAGAAMPEGFTVAVHKRVIVQTDYDLDTGVTPPVFS
jgi:hypothetical protein